MLSDRRQKVLAALIEEYVAHVVPVGSRTLTERYHLGVSSATVRNELSILED
ncbi:MAG: heat-inducible transcription repressor HrcA, partial [Raoultibacter sp.]